MSYFLYLLRHAQSADKQIGQTDKERTISATGLLDAKATGNFLKERFIIPELIVTSSAVRAIETAQIVAETVNYKSSELLIKDELYNADVTILSQTISTFNNDVKRVMVVGHNPGLSFLSTQLLKGLSINLSPAELVIINLGFATWKELTSAKCKLEIRYPKI